MANAAPPANLPVKSKNASVLDWLTMLGFIAILFIPLLVNSFGAERARWQLASVYEKILANELDEAASILDSINLTDLRMDPISRMSVVEALLELKRYREALEACRAIKIEGFVKEDRKALMVKYMHLEADCLNYLGREREALGVVKERYQILPQFNVSRELRMNHLAYQRGLAGVELGAAQRAALELIKSQGRPLFEGQDIEFWQLPFGVRAAIACALIHVDVRDQAGGTNSDELALKLLDLTIESQQELLGNRKQGLIEQIYERFGGRFPFGNSFEKRLADTRKENEYVAHQLAMMLVARSLVYQAANDETQRVQDLRAAQALGFSPEKLLVQLPGGNSCRKSVAEGAMYGDTLGFVLQRENKLRSAEQWLDLAVTCGEYSRLWELSGQKNVLSELYEDPRVELRKKEKTLAVIYYHRKKLFDALRDEEKAMEAARGIEAMGYADGAVLF